MPSKSPAQARLMQAVAHNPAFAAKVDIPQKVGQEFNDADEVKRKSARVAQQIRQTVPAKGV